MILSNRTWSECSEKVWTHWRVDISHTWCKKGDWGILNEKADENKNAEPKSQRKKKLKPQCSVVLQKQIYRILYVKKWGKFFIKQIFHQ
jgi:hypothetical protein